jgi:hypothetical protein
MVKAKRWLQGAVVGFQALVGAGAATTYDPIPGRGLRQRIRRGGDPARLAGEDQPGAY